MDDPRICDRIGTGTQVLTLALSTLIVGEPSQLGMALLMLAA